jgi:hypothetical protein
VHIDTADPTHPSVRAPAGTPVADAALVFLRNAAGSLGQERCTAAGVNYAELDAGVDGARAQVCYDDSGPAVRVDGGCPTSPPG